MIGAIIAKHKINKAFENLNNRNLDAFLDGWSDDGIFKYPGNLSVSGDIEGLPAVKKWFQNMLNQYPIIQFKIHHICVENIFDMVGTNTLIAYWSVSLTNKEGVSVQNLGTKHGKDQTTKSDRSTRLLLLPGTTAHWMGGINFWLIIFYVFWTKRHRLFPGKRQCDTEGADPLIQGDLPQTVNTYLLQNLTETELRVFLF